MMDDIVEADARHRHADPAHRHWLRAESTRLLEFYEASADFSGGGFYWLGDGASPLDVPKSLLITARMTYSFALACIDGRPKYARYVQHGLDSMRTVFRDKEFGGFTSTVRGAQADTVLVKRTYDHAFVMLAATTASLAGLDATDLLDQAASAFDNHIYDPAEGLCGEAWDTRWCRSEDYRGANANMHAVEGLLAAYSMTADDKFLHMATSIARRIVAFAADNNWRIPEHFTPGWKPRPGYNADHPGDQFRPYGATPGHAFEWCRLLIQLPAQSVHDRSWALNAAQAMFHRAVTDGWDTKHRGLAYTVDWQGRPAVTERLHWPIAEAIGAADYLFRSTGESEYSDWYDTFWAFAVDRLIDHTEGGWFHELTIDGKPSARIWAGKSDLYHALQATIYARAPMVETLGAALLRTERDPGE